tara:strand:+ start:76 stop:423 length:348 start_codon:yes stop_codon:yes gene_type:complete
MEQRPHTMTVGEAGVEFRSRLPGVLGYRRQTIADRCRAGEIPAKKIGKEWRILTEWIDGEVNSRLLELDDLIRKKMIVLAQTHPSINNMKVRSKHWSEETVNTQLKLRILEESKR